jgi:4-hydroxy-3-methylbut-2-enyl diphosphate reductase
VERGFQVILVGHAGHPEVEGVRGQVPHGLTIVGSEADVAALDIPASASLAYVTQTTLSATDTSRIIAALRARFPDIIGPDLRDICYATQNRQNAVIEMARQVDLVLVIGSANSSNSNRLCEVSKEAGVQAYLIDGPQDLDAQWLQGVASVGLTAGASAPEIIVQRTLEFLSERFSVSVETLDGANENVHFRLPVRLMDAAE